MDRVQNCGMPFQRFVPAPPDLQPWVEAGVVVDCPAELAQSQFPAMVASMLVVRLAGQVMCQGAQVPQAAWMSASTRATVYEHQGRVHAVGLVLRPEAAAALFAGARGAVNAVYPMAELAVDQGYYDQSHMGRDVRRLAGQPLQALVQDTQTPLSTHWPLQIGAETHPKPLHQPTWSSQPAAPARQR